jgi:hypothetical protein
MTKEKNALDLWKYFHETLKGERSLRVLSGVNE